MSSREPLSVWLYGTRIATLSEGADDRPELTWTTDALDRWGSGSRIMSHLLPLTRPGATPPRARVLAFLDGLLPEGRARDDHATDAGVSPDDTFGLVARFGRDTAGALVFQPGSESSSRSIGSYRTLSDDELGRRLEEVTAHSRRLLDRDSSTVAGLQPKIVLHRDPTGHWQACLDGAPSTWIVKVAQPVDSVAGDVVDTEVLSLDLARASGLRAASAELITVGRVRAIAVRRYDRRTLAEGRLGRLHQEDLAQALGLNTSDPQRKFQRGRALPSLSGAAAVLRSGGSEPDDLLRLTVLNYLLGNIDAHAKNISFLRHDDGTASLAPAYDIAMHGHHGKTPGRSALDINGKSDYAAISPTDLIAEAAGWGIPSRRAARVVGETTDRVRTAIESVDLSGYPGVSERALANVRSRLPS